MSTSHFELIVSFDGPAIKDGRIDVRDLAPALLALGKAIEASNAVLNGPDKPVKVEAIATSVGSFEIVVDVAIPFWESVKTLLASGDVTSAKDLLEWIGLIGSVAVGGVAGVKSLVGFVRALDGRKIRKVAKSDQDGYVRVVLDDEGRVSITVPVEVLRLYQEIAVQRELSNLLDVLKREAVETIAFRDRADEAPQTVFTRDDQERFKPPVLVAEPLLDTTQLMALSIRSLAFQEGNKWRLYDGQNTITATIEDKDFLDRVDRSIARFAKGDILMCRVRTVQLRTADGLRTEHTVVKVEEHRPAATQINLPFGE